VYKAMARGARERSLDAREENSALLNVAAENYQAMPVVKLFGLKGRESGRFGRQAGRLFRSQRRLSLFGGLFGLSVNMIVTLLRLGVLGFGAWLILQDRFTIGGLVAFLAIMGDVIGPVTVLTSLGQNIQSASGALLRINELLDAEPEPGDADKVDLPPLQRELVLSDIAFSYNPERRVLDGIDAVIPAGSNVAFVGPSGSGKSTVLRLIMRLFDPEEGMITVDETDVTSASMASWRNQMAVVFQDSFLFNTTIRENIGLGKPGATDEEIRATAEAAELDETIADLPRGYDTLVGQRGSNLSGGQRQRVAIARALIRNPRLLLLDEATSALDAATESQISETLRRVGADRTVIAITHRLTSITRYDQIFVVEAGRLVEFGTHDQLVSLGGTYARLWADQTGAELQERAPFDAAGALSKLVLFRDLERPDLEDIVGRLRSFVLRPGEEIGDGGRRLLLVQRGRGEVLTPSLGGELVVTAELGVGDAFGVRALLGKGGSYLRASEAVTLLEIDNAVLDGIIARYPAVAAVLDSTTRADGGPSGGRKVTPAAFAVARIKQVEGVMK
jgi:ATP-binding cassette subfamily B protein